MPSIEVDASGPIFNNLQSAAAVREFVRQAEQDIAQQALADVHLILDRSIRHPTPYYETQLTQQRRGEAQVVHDRGVIYGPWLEGVSSRNRTSRFKGYAAFRRTKQALRAKTPRLIEHSLQRCIARLGGS